MLTSELQYDLPPDRIAQSPAERRDQSRLLVFNRNSGKIAHHFFTSYPTCSLPGYQFFVMMFLCSKPAFPGNDQLEAKWNVYSSAPPILPKTPGTAF
jgi:hypothetical protein